MNSYRAKGVALYLGGKAQEVAGLLTLNRRRQAAGFEKRIRGEAMLAIARAQRLIRDYSDNDRNQEQACKAASGVPLLK
jgi:uncharacterized protein YjbJ (UPF0337 family)